MDPWFESLVSGCFYSQTRLRTESECSEEFIWSFPDSSSAFNDTSFLSHTGWERYCSTHYRKDLSQNSPWSKAVLWTKFHRPTFRETKSPVPNSYSFSKNTFNIAEEPDFFHSFSNQLSLTKWFPLVLLFTAILNKCIMVKTGSFLPISHRRACVSYNPSGKASRRKRQ